jgi:hypothetical protein
MTFFFGDGSDSHCWFLWNVSPVYRTVHRHLLDDCSHNVHYVVNFKSVMENFVLNRMLRLQKEDASIARNCIVCMSHDFQ